MKTLTGKTLRNQTIEEWFRKCQPRDLRELKTDYVARYNAFADYVEKEIHPLVAVGAAVNNGVFLNAHGKPHVDSVIKRASQLIETESCVLSAYEVYFLLTAVQLHDVWNILGRDGHEVQFREHSGRIEELLGDESAEKRVIKRIAEAHGGKHNGDEDTIQHIIDEPVLNQAVRAKFLAALLRFADEVADDSQRVSPFAIQVGSITPESLLFHKYSSSLQSVMIDAKGKAIELHYELTREDAQQEFQKNGHSWFLIEEILHRNLKMHRERIYCMRFLIPSIQIDSISTKINIYRSKNSAQSLFVIGYRLEDKGYPSASDSAIYKLCPELAKWHEGEPLNGKSLIARIEGSIK